MTGSSPTKDSDIDSILTGTTLRVYKAMIGMGRPLGPRELQKKLGLSTPSLALFHLEKLERAGLLTKTDEGTYSLNIVYLKHFVRVRKILVPRFIFQASLATFFVLGWILVYFTPNFKIALAGQSSAVSLIYLYGLAVTVILAFFFWFETFRVMKQEKI